MAGVSLHSAISPFMRNTLKYGIINTHHQGAFIYM